MVDEFSRRTEPPGDRNALIHFDGPLSQREQQHIEETVRSVEASGQLLPVADLFRPRWWVVADAQSEGSRLFIAYRLGEKTTITASRVEALTRAILRMQDRSSKDDACAQT